MQQHNQALEEAREIVAEEANRLKEQQLLLYDSASYERVEIDNQLELLRHILRRFDTELR